VVYKSRTVTQIKQNGPKTIMVIQVEYLQHMLTVTFHL